MLILILTLALTLILTLILTVILFFSSCALLVDINVSVWDIRRPYIPHAQFTQHKDSVTGNGGILQFERVSSFSCNGGEWVMGVERVVKELERYFPL